MKEISSLSTPVMWRNLKLNHMWRNSRFLPMTDVEKSEISPHDRFFSTRSAPEPEVFSNTRTRSVPKLKPATRWSLVLTDVIFGVESFGGGKPTSIFWSLDSGWGRTLLFMWWLLLTSVLHFKGHCCKVYQRCVRGGRKVPLEFSKLLLSLSLLCNVNPWKVARGPRFYGTEFVTGTSSSDLSSFNRNYFFY